MSFAANLHNDQYAEIMNIVPTVINAFAKMHCIDHHLLSYVSSEDNSHLTVWIAHKGSESISNMFRRYNIETTHIIPEGREEYHTIDITQLGLREKLGYMARDTLGEMSALQKQIKSVIQRDESRRGK